MTTLEAAPIAALPQLPEPAAAAPAHPVSACNAARTLSVVAVGLSSRPSRFASAPRLSAIFLTSLTARLCSTLTAALCTRPDMLPMTLLPAAPLKAVAMMRAGLPAPKSLRKPDASLIKA